MKDIRQPQIIAGRVNSDGSIAAGSGFTVVKGAAGSGNYSIVVPASFRLVSATANCSQLNSYYALAVSFSATSFTVSLGSVSASPVAVDSAFTFVAVGQA